jgi:hypothetical protein
MKIPGILALQLKLGFVLLIIIVVLYLIYKGFRWATSDSFVKTPYIDLYKNSGSKVRCNKCLHSRGKIINLQRPEVDEESFSGMEEIDYVEGTSRTVKHDLAPSQHRSSAYVEYAHKY